MKVLLIGNNDRSALSACRALGEGGAWVGIAPAGDWGVAQKSRHCKALHDTVSLSEDVEGCGRGILQLVQDHQYEVVMPLTDAAVLLCQQIRDEFSPVKVALPPADAFRFSYDKRLLLERCRELDIPAPVETSIEKTPLFIKPIHSAILHQNRALSFQVKRVATRREAEDFLREHAAVVDVLMQEEYPGPGCGVHLLAKEGEILTMVQQNRLHEPSGGGSGSYRCTMPLEPDLEEYTVKLIRSIKWTGVAMLEFKGGPGRWRVMELNGRFWGSLALTVAAGLNLPLWLAQMTLGQEPDVRTPHYGIHQRHLGKDIAWAVREQKILEWASDFLTHRDPLDVEKASDPLPALAYWASGGRRIGKWLNERVEIRDYRKQESILREGTLNDFNIDRRVLFVCRGNICRSPFAEAYCRQKLGWRHVKSCGTFPVPERRPSEAAEQVANQNFQVDLSEQRSQVLSGALLRWADVVFVMDRKQLVELAPQLKGKMLLLARGAEISDPYRGSEETYRECYREIARACKEIHSHATLPHSS